MWFLVIISLMGPVPTMFMSPPLKTMEECFEARELAVDGIGRPIINYQAVCIQKLKES